ncbi:hypothetical protein JTB14_030470, partial [Gonioctena quinquepunctata]
YSFDGPDDHGPHPVQSMNDPSFDPDNILRNRTGSFDQTPEFQEEVEMALRTESQMTVYDPEDLNTTMAPRTNNLEVRREVFFNTFNRELAEHEEDENAEVHEILQQFHRQRRQQFTEISNA